MPYMQAIIERINAVTNRQNIDAIDGSLLAAGTTLADAAVQLGIAQSQAEIDYVSAWPAGQQEAVRAALYSAVTRTPRLPVTFAWEPGYDYRVAISEAAGTADSIGGITIVIQSRYPADQIPGVV